MRTRYRLYKRGNRGGTYYCLDQLTGHRTSLKTADRWHAETLLRAKNEADAQPLLNMEIARAYAAASDPGILTRTWEHVPHDKALKPILSRKVVETHPQHFLEVLEKGTATTNTYLRRIHNFALDCRWLLHPVLLKNQWPPVRFKEKRAITPEEHRRIVEREPNTEYRNFYKLLWHLSGSQSDVAHLRAEDVDWKEQTIAYARKKTSSVCLIRFGEEMAAVLKELPPQGYLFPREARMHEKNRAKEFHRRCKGLNVHGVSLHSYRYAWAERAKTAGYPERFAQAALGHNSKAVHRVYSRKAAMQLPCLEDYERDSGEKIIPMEKAG